MLWIQMREDQTKEENAMEMQPKKKKKKEVNNTCLKVMRWCVDRGIALPCLPTHPILPSILP
jgi:hypothetical protein